jgi:hypothetical protein
MPLAFIFNAPELESTCQIGMIKPVNSPLQQLPPG